MTTKIKAAIDLMKAAREAIRIKEVRTYRDCCRQIHFKQTEECEGGLCEAIAPMFDDQLKEAADRLRKIKWKPIETKSKTDRSGAARIISAQIFRPNDWDQELVNRALPSLVKTMIDARAVQWSLLAEVPVKDKRAVVKEKASTATQWMHAETDESLQGMTFNTPQGPVSISISTEFPDWMKADLEQHLRDTFSQDYWWEVNQSTLGDIEGIIRQGLLEGWSVERMALEMSDNLMQGGKYALQRGRTIARTEVGHALNGARSSAIDELINDVGRSIPMRKSWLSVLGNTTRDTHADCDGVPADKEGMWMLGGYRVRWPADINLPAKERCNCQCSVIVEYGMTDTEADMLIAEHYDRMGEKSTPYFIKAFCPTGDGGGVDPTCSPGESGSSAGGSSSGPKPGIDGAGEVERIKESSDHSEARYRVGGLKIDVDVSEAELSGYSNSELLEYVKEQYDGRDPFDGFEQMESFVAKNPKALLRAYKNGSADEYLDELKEKAVDKAWKDWAARNKEAFRDLRSKSDEQENRYIKWHRENHPEEYGDE